MKKKQKENFQEKNDPQAMKSLEIEVFLIIYHINCNSPTDNEYYNYINRYNAYYYSKSI